MRLVKKSRNYSIFNFFFYTLSLSFFFFLFSSHPVFPQEIKGLVTKIENRENVKIFFGDDKGLNENGLLYIYRKQKFIGVVQIHRIEKYNVYGKILSHSRGIEPGDEALLLPLNESDKFTTINSEPNIPDNKTRKGCITHIWSATHVNIDLNEKDGLAEGDCLAVYRKNIKIGDLTIIYLGKMLTGSSCRFTSTGEEHPIKGDVVQFVSPSLVANNPPPSPQVIPPMPTQTQPSEKEERKEPEQQQDQTSTIDIASHDSLSADSDFNPVYVARRGSTKFHLLSCKYVPSIPENKRIYFDSFENAQEANLSPCKDCFRRISVNVVNQENSHVSYHQNDDPLITQRKNKIIKKFIEFKAALDTGLNYDQYCERLLDMSVEIKSNMAGLPSDFVRTAEEALDDYVWARGAWHDHIYNKYSDSFSFDDPIMQEVAQLYLKKYPTIKQTITSDGRVILWDDVLHEAWHSAGQHIDRLQ